MLVISIKLPYNSVHVDRCMMTSMATPSETKTANAKNYHQHTLDRSLHERAKKLNEQQTIHLIYGTGDGLVNGYGLTKSIFEVRHYGESQIAALDEMHEWMQTPTGLVFSIVSSLVFVTFASLGNLFLEQSDRAKKTNQELAAYKEYTAVYWKVLRELFQALRNSFKSIRTAIIAFTLFCVQDFRFLIIPFTLTFGILYTLNRIFLLEVQEKRKSMVQHNKDLYDFLFSKKEHDLEILLHGNLHKATEAPEFGLSCLAIKAFNGLIDSFYLLFGVLTIVNLAPSFLLLGGLFSIAYSAVLIATRIYEEYEPQRELAISGYRVDSALSSYRLQIRLNLLQKISIQLTDPERNQTQLKKVQALVLEKTNLLFKQFLNNQQLLLQSSTLSPWSILLLGAKRGIAAYGALLSLLICVTVLSAFWFGVFFSPGAILGCIVAGTPIILGFVIHAWCNAASNRDYIASEQEKLNHLKSLIESIKDNKSVINPSLVTDTKRLFQTIPHVRPLTDSYTTTLLEMGRTSGSAMLKGKKELEFLMNSFQQPDAGGHYQDSPLMMLLIAPFSLIYGIFFALRAFVKGYSKDLSQQEYKPISLTKEELANKERTMFNPNERPAKKEFYPFLFHRFFTNDSDSKKSNRKKEKFFDEDLNSYQDHCTF